MISAGKKALMGGVKPAAPFSRSGSFEGNSFDGFVADGFALTTGSARTGSYYLYATRENRPLLRYVLDRSVVAKLQVTFSIWGLSGVASQGAIEASIDGGVTFTTIATKVWATAFQQFSGSIRVGSTGLILQFTHNNVNGRFDDWQITGVR